MKTLAKFVEAASVWNALRYEQEFDLDLSIEMLKEELEEYLKATVLVEQVDALCDICFIAAGALWKLRAKYNNETFNSFYNFYMLADIDYMDATNNQIQVMRNYPGYYTTACCLHQILAATFDLLSYKLSSQEAALDALFCIVESNNTKSVKNIPTGAKYSSEGKGSEYVSPTAALIKLIAGILNETKH